MSYLSWIRDEDLKKEVDTLLSVAKNAQLKATNKFGKNVIDPFAAMFEISGFELDYETWMKSETTRQAQKTLQNYIGEFHQSILGYSNGWDNLKTGKVIDLMSEDKKIIAEVKNKYNTISGGKLSDLYYSLDNLVSPKSSIYKGYIAYYVAIIPKKGLRYNRPFTPSNKAIGSKCPTNNYIREIDGASFYSIVTGIDNALEELFEVLPEVIKVCSFGKYQVENKAVLREFFNLAYK